MEEEILKTSQIFLCMVFMVFFTACLDIFLEDCLHSSSKHTTRKMYQHLEDLA